MPHRGETDARGNRDERPEKRYKRELKRGSIANALGTVGRLLYLAYVIVATRLFGAEAAGLYSTAFVATELAASLVVTGLADGTVLLGSRETELIEQDKRSDADRYDIFATAMVVSVAASLLWIVLVFLLGRAAGAHFWSDRTEVVRGAQILATVLPARALMEMSVAATKADLRMDIDAWIRGGLRPALLLVAALVARWWSEDWLALCVSNVVAEIVVALVALGVFSRLFDLGALTRAIGRLRLRRDLLRFAAPQGASHTLYQYITQIDLLMLAALGVSAAHVAYYWTVSVVAQNLRQIRVVFSNTLMPILARHHAAGETEAMEILLGRLSRWALTLVVMVVLLAIGIRDDLFSLASPSYRQGGAFVLVLFAIPIVNCGLGLASNAIIATGHSEWGLFNGILIAAINTGLNLLWIPEYGLFGAAAASLTATIAIMLLNVAELRWLEGVRWRWSAPIPVWIALVVAAGLYAWLWDPADMKPFALRLAISLGAVALFVVAAAAAGHPEVRATLRKLRGR